MTSAQDSAGLGRCTVSQSKRKCCRICLWRPFSKDSHGRGRRNLHPVAATTPASTSCSVQRRIDCCWQVACATAKVTSSQLLEQKLSPPLPSSVQHRTPASASSGSASRMSGRPASGCSGQVFILSVPSIPLPSTILYSQTTSSDGLCISRRH